MAGGGWLEEGAKAQTELPDSNLKLLGRKEDLCHHVSLDKKNMLSKRGMRQEL